jgi:hypothetical protein
MTHLAGLNVLREVLVDPACVTQVNDLAVRLCNVPLPVVKRVVINEAAVTIRLICVLQRSMLGLLVGAIIISAVYRACKRKHSEA